MFRNKKGEKMGLMGIVAVVAVIALVMMMNKPAAQTPAPQPPGPVVNTGCSLTPQFTMYMADKYIPGTSIAGTYLYKINNGAVQVGTLGTAINVAVGDTVEYVTNSSVYSDFHGSKTMICGTGNREDALVLNDLDADADVTIQLFNSNNGNLNAITDNQTLAANDIKDIDLKITPLSKKGGKDCVMTIDYNSSTYDEISVAGKTKVSNPTFINVLNVANTLRSYQLGTLENAQQLQTTLHVDVKNVEPTNSGASVITTYINCADWYVNTDTGSFAYGLEDQNGAEVVDGTANIVTEVFYVS